MDIFTFDNRFFFDRQSYDDCWYAYAHPSLMSDDPDAFANGYFSVLDCKFVRDAVNVRGFSEEQKRQIEQILAEHKSDMKLEQFDVHKELPTHYKELGGKSNRFSGVLRRLRTYGMCDPDVSVAFDQIINEDPAYRLTREFVLKVLERATQVSEEDRSDWLHEGLKDTWDCDVWPYAESGETFESFYQEEIKKLLFPNRIRRRKDTVYRIYEIEGLPGVYLFSEETDLPDYGMKTRDSRHFLDRDSAVVPIPLPGCSGQAYYIL